MRQIVRVLTLILTVSPLAFGAAAADRLELAKGWQIQSSAKAKQTGDVISTAKVSTKGWYEATVPTTVVAALIANKVYPSPYIGKNLRDIPGTEYPIGENFSNLPFPPDSPFAVPWWYRTAFRVPAAMRGKRVTLNFDGINFRANIWLNGKQIASSEKVAGAYRTFKFDITGDLKKAGPNVLAVEIIPPQPDDLAITFVDWNPLPPDKDMGLWRHVYLTFSGPIQVTYPQVVTKFDLPKLDEAHLTVNAEVANLTDQPVAAKIKATVQGHGATITVSKVVQLKGSEARTVSFTPQDEASLNVKDPKLWWPVFMGEPNLYTLKVEAVMNGKVSDSAGIRFGMRQVTAELTGAEAPNPSTDNGEGPTFKGGLLFRVNGKKILIRGAGWTYDMLLNRSAKRKRDEIRYVKDLNLNTIRLEGKLETQDFYDDADEMGILIMPGWVCCDNWEHWKKWDQEDMEIAGESLKSQALLTRSHPSVFVWLYGSDNPPPPNVEKMYLEVLEKNAWPNPTISSATARPTEVTGKSGVKMAGPYDWVPPNYWEEDTAHGGAFNFNTETSPGAAVPQIESLRKFIPKDHLWPIDDYWDYHAGGGQFRTLASFTKAITERYGAPTSAEDYTNKSQLITYEGERAMFEGFGRNKYNATGVIQWMLNNAWPSMIWHLYDYYLLPGGGYFGAKKACEPLHIQYSYDNRAIAVVNSRQQAFSDLKASVKMYDIDLTEKFSQEASVDVGPDGVETVMTLPEPEIAGPTYFVKLDLFDSAGKNVSTNFYWLSTKKDVLDWKNTQWWATPTVSYADLTGINKLPRVKLTATAHSRHSGANGAMVITVENPTHSLAFAVELRLAKAKGGDDVLPALWQDNYFALMPGEKREITVSYRGSDAGSHPMVEVRGWNVDSAWVRPSVR